MTTDLTKQDRKAMLALATKGTSTFHPAIQLLHPNSEAVTSGKGKAGEFLFGEHNLSDIVKIFICAQRFHAIYLQNKVRKLESFDFQSPITKEIVAKLRKYQDGEDPRYGLSFLVYLPELDKFAVFHPNVPSARPVAADIMDHYTPPDERSSEAAKQMPHTNCLILSSSLLKSRNPHYVPNVTPQQPTKEWAPGNEELKEAMAIFSAPVDAEREQGPVEKATEAEER